MLNNIKMLLFFATAYLFYIIFDFEFTVVTILLIILVSLRN